jgi:hypothetical protein
MAKIWLALSSAALLLGPLFLVSVAGGCGSTVTAEICDALCTCTPCTDNDRADCTISADAAEQKSRSACAAPFDAYLNCAAENVRCHEPQALNTRCIAEITELIRCDATLPIIGTACEASSIKVAVCLDTPASNGGQSTCTGRQACNAQCTIKASCPQIKDVFTGAQTPVGQPLADCLSACSQQQGS